MPTIATNVGPEDKDMRIKHLSCEGSLYQLRDSLDALQTFYFGVNFFLTRPEVIWKNVYTSFISSITVRETSGPVEDANLLGKYKNLFFHLVTREDVDKYFLSSDLEMVELERVWVVNNETESHVTFLEVWDFKQHIVRYGPKFRCEFEESDYCQLIPLIQVEISMLFRTRSPHEVYVIPYAIKPDDQQLIHLFRGNGVDNFSRVFENYSATEWDVKNTGLAHHPTLLYVDRNNYLHFYNRMKKEYFNKLVSLWAFIRESTDPFKFIPEDMHISIYLERLQANRSGPITFGKRFVDVGCGNGLLTYLLTKLGWTGYGIDCRRRKLWTEFEKEETRYEEFTIRFDSMLTGVDNETILIGNHPDELAPLIPLLTVLNGAAGFILIPCCAYDIFGRKHVRSTSKVSVFESHVRALLKMSKDLGFETKLDKLRIPSTKRMAILGTIRPLTSTYEDIVEMKAREMFLNNILSQLKEAPPAPSRLPQRVDNCTQLSRECCESLVKKVFNLIFSSKCSGPDICESCQFPRVAGSEEVKWQQGCRRISIRMIVNALKEGELLFLKNQGNGLQTLLRNYSDVFVLEKGFVQIRLPEKGHIQKKISRGKGRKLRTKHCFFHFHHPDGCPLKEKDCAFSHQTVLYVRNWTDAAEHELPGGPEESEE